jgi:hypothetical protein
MNNDLLLLLIIAVVSAVLLSRIGYNSIDFGVATITLISVSIWLLFQRFNEYKPDEPEGEPSVEEIAQDINHDAAYEEEGVPDLTHRFARFEPQKLNEDEFEIEFHARGTYEEGRMKDMFPHMGCNGDTALFNRMKYMSVQPQMAAVNRESFNKYSAQPWFEEELREHAEREWWNADHLDAEF